VGPNLGQKGWRAVGFSLPPKRVTRNDVKRIRARAYEMSEAERAEFQPDLFIERPLASQLA